MVVNERGKCEREGRGRKRELESERERSLVDDKCCRLFGLDISNIGWSYSIKILVFNSPYNDKLWIILDDAKYIIRK